MDSMTIREDWGDMIMKWAEFKKEWNELDKKDKSQIIANIIGTLASSVLIILGCVQMSEYVELIPDDHRLAIGGAFICSVGFWAFHIFWIKGCWRVIHKFDDRIEKLEEELKTE